MSFCYKTCLTSKIRKLSRSLLTGDSPHCSFKHNSFHSVTESKGSRLAFHQVIHNVSSNITKTIMAMHKLFKCKKSSLCEQFSRRKSTDKP